MSSVKTKDTLLSDFFWRFMRNPLALSGGLMIVVLFVVAALAPLISPADPNLIDTANILAGLRMPAAVIAAGLLHDTVEDTPVTLEDIRQDFGTRRAAPCRFYRCAGQTGTGAPRHLFAGLGDGTEGIPPGDRRHAAASWAARASIALRSSGTPRNVLNPAFFCVSK